MRNVLVIQGRLISAKRLNVPQCPRSSIRVEHRIDRDDEISPDILNNRVFAGRQSIRQHQGGIR
jgi:hypothetical protein